MVDDGHPPRGPADAALSEGQAGRGNSHDRPVRGRRHRLQGLGGRAARPLPEAHERHPHVQARDRAGRDPVFRLRRTLRGARVTRRVHGAGGRRSDRPQAHDPAATGQERDPGDLPHGARDRRDSESARAHARRGELPAAVPVGRVRAEARAQPRRRPGPRARHHGRSELDAGAARLSARQAGGRREGPLHREPAAMQPVLPIVFALAVQQIPLQAGMTLTYVHRNFDRNRDDEIRTWIVRMTGEESVWNAEWVANPCPGPEDHMSRREQLGARSMDFARGGTADQTVAEHRPHTLYMLSARLLRGLREGETMDMIVPVLANAEIILGGSSDTTTGRCKMPHMVLQLVRGQAQRVGDDTTETVIVDGRGVTVPIMRVHADFVSLIDQLRIQGDMWFVDDTAAAWVTRVEMTRQDQRTFHMALGTVTTPGPPAARPARPRPGCREARSNASSPIRAARPCTASTSRSTARRSTPRRSPRSRRSPTCSAGLPTGRWRSKDTLTRSAILRRT